ncbi:MAG: BatD family protein [Paramuribaculum sp.]|nr:BatD family protein [Paramuribaculum sp.]
MRESFRLTFSLIAVIFSALCAMAQQFTLMAPQRVFKGEKFAVTYRLTNAQGGEPRVPQINGCQLLFGPSVTTRQSYQVSGNGQTSSQSSTDFTYTYRADQTGDFTIGSATIQANGKTLKTKPQTLTIVESPAAGRQQSDRQPSTNRPVSIDDIETQSADRAVSANDVFVRIILSKSTAYEQEAIECTIKLYTKFGISQFFPTKQPSFDGFLIEEVNFQSSLNQEETYNGQRYLVALLKKCIIYPQKSGKLTINSGNYDLNVIQYSNTNLGFLSLSTPREKKIQVTSNTASIDIKPLPTPKPEGFTGAVGKFDISSRLVGNSFRTNEPATLIYTITGTGNIKYVKEPVIDFPTEFELYDPKTDYDTKVVGNNVSGTMTTEYTFVPQSVGKFTIGADKFVYFDPSKNDYVTLTTPSYPISVIQGSESVDKQDVEVKNKDILHIMTGSKSPTHGHRPVIGQWWYWMIYLLMAGGLWGSVRIYGRNVARSADIRGMRLAKANKVARQRLKTAATFMQSGNNSDRFYEELLKATWGYLSDKLGIPVSQLSRENVSAELTSYGADEQLCSTVISILDQCEMARYAPAATHSELEKIYNEATEAINNLETIKRK